MKNDKLIKMVTAGLFTAMIFVLTRFVSIPMGVGYVHLGDALAYLCAAIIGGPWAIFAASVGEALADVTAGWVSYAPATLLIKAAICVPFIICGRKSNKILTPLTALMTLPAGLITVAGYFIADMIIDKAYAVVNIAGNALQAVCSGLLFMVIAAAFDAVGFKKKYFINRR